MKSELKKLNERVGKLPAREQEVIRLRYSDGLSYKDIAAAANVPVEEAQSLLLSAINTLRGKAPGAGNKARYMAFVHGELNEADTQAMADLVEADAGARGEFESMLAMSDALTDLYDSLIEEKSKGGKKSASTLEKIREAAALIKAGKGAPVGRPRLLIAGAFFAVSAAIILFIAIDMGSGGDEEPTTEPAAIAMDAESAPPEPAPMPQPEPPAVTEETAAVVAAAPVEPTTPPAAAEPTFAPPPPQPLDMPTDKPAIVKTGKKLMTVDTGKTVISKNINKKTALAFLSKKLNKSPSCIPAADKKSKLIKSVIGVTKDGTYTQVTVLAPTAGKAAIAKCLRGRLGSTAKSLKTNNKSGGKITLVLKVI